MRHWYPFYPGDYSRDTSHLSMIEHGAYRLLLDYYYMTGQPLSANGHANADAIASVLYRVCRAFDDAEKAAINKVLSEFFELKEDGWHHTRADAEIEKSKDISKKRAGAANTRHNKTPSNADANADANAKQLETQPQLQPHPQKTEITTDIETATTLPETKKVAVVPMRVSECQELSIKYLKKLNDSLGPVTIFQDICRNYSPDCIREAFQAAGAANATSLNWVLKRLKGENNGNSGPDNSGSSKAARREKSGLKAGEQSRTGKGSYAGDFKDRSNEWD